MMASQTRICFLCLEEGTSPEKGRMVIRGSGILGSYPVHKGCGDRLEELFWAFFRSKYQDTLPPENSPELADK
jgi:hypothetical protein